MAPSLKIPDKRLRPLKVAGPVRTSLILFGDQLNRDAAALSELDGNADAVLMMEVAEEATHVPGHKQRTTLFLAAMRHFAIDLAERGYRVHYVPLDDPENTHSFETEIKRFVRNAAPQRLVAIHPGEWRVCHKLEAIRRDFGLPLDVVADDHFLLTPAEFNEWATGRKRLVLEHFYRHMRRRLGVFMNDDEPEGGRWNYDDENRATFSEPPDVPRPYYARPDGITRSVMELVAQRFPDAPGSLAHFRWPVTRVEARRALDKFIGERLPRFGRYQDAVWAGEPILYHAALSSSLNLKLLDPREVVAAVVAAYEAGRAPLNAVEGFVRQVIGWREFIRGVYWREGSDYGMRNGLDQHGTLPGMYWDPTATDMNCMRQCVGQVMEHGYGHHIQRLMVTGNFALTAGVHPRAVSDWYLGMYVDAVDWVTLPNTLGMVMHADGGVVGTKPYAASGRYIRRMSNYCDGCRYDPARRSGDRACPVTTFYWDFLMRTAPRFRSNPRMKMMLKNLERLAPEQQQEIRQHARRLRVALGVGAIDGRGG